jgi:DNA-binding LytR/AlgR family response regulator
MKPLTAIVADDEEIIRASLVRHLEKLWPELAVIGQAGNGLDALALLEQGAPDIAFLDIRMPGMTGLEVARQSRDSCNIVFITAYDQYAVQAFESEAVDYILKPVNPDRLAVTIARLKKRCRAPGSDIPGPDTESDSAHGKPGNPRPPESDHGQNRQMNCGSSRWHR